MCYLQKMYNIPVNIKLHQLTLKGFVNNGLLCLKLSSNGLVTIVLSVYVLYFSAVKKVYYD